jgi:hypothetical protein
VRAQLAISGVVVAGLTVTAAVASADPRANTKYEGVTSQNQEVILRTNGTGGSVKSFLIRRNLRCGSQLVKGDFRTDGLMVIKADGRFGASAKVTPVSGGQIKRGVFNLKGSFGPRGRVAKGTYRERVRLRDDTRCDTGKVRFRVQWPIAPEAKQL